MLSTFLRKASRCLPLAAPHSTQLQRVVQRFASISMREFLHESSDETGTLLTRFAKHIALEAHRVDAPLVSTTIRYADFFPITEMRYFQKELNRTPANQLPALIIFASTYRTNADARKFVSLLNDLDTAAVQKLPNMDEDTVYRTLYALLFLMPNWVMRTDFYNAAVRQLAEKQFTPDAPKERFVQLCFYLGLDKKRMSTVLQKFLEKHLEMYLPELSKMDLAVVSNAAYKASARVPYLAYNLRLEEELQKLPLEDATEDALLVTFVKALRLQCFHSEAVCKRLEAVCTHPNRLGQLQARGVIHLFAYFAENLWDNNTCTEAIVTQFMQKLRESQRFNATGELVRGKDIATFLWCCAQLNCNISSDDMQLIESSLLHKVDNNEFRFFADQLVDSCLSLWILGYKSRDLLQEAVRLKSDSSHVGKQQRQQPKVDSRYTVLLSAAQIEAPTWRGKTTTKTSPLNLETAAPTYLLKDRKDLTDYTKRLCGEGLTEPILVCPINGINIPSVLVYFDTPATTKVFVELINKEHALRFSKTPTALLRLKIRLLNALGCKVVTLHLADLTDKYTCLKDLVFDTDTDDQPKEESISSI